MPLMVMWNFSGKWESLPLYRELLSGLILCKGRWISVPAYLCHGLNCNPLMTRILLAAPGKGGARKTEFFEWHPPAARSRLRLFNGVFQTRPLICWMKKSRVIKLRRLIGLMRRWTRRDEMTYPVLFDELFHGAQIGKFIRKILWHCARCKSLTTWTSCTRRLIWIYDMTNIRATFLIRMLHECYNVDKITFNNNHSASEVNICVSLCCIL